MKIEWNTTIAYFNIILSSLALIQLGYLTLALILVGVAIAFGIYKWHNYLKAKKLRLEIEEDIRLIIESDSLRLGLLRELEQIRLLHRSDSAMLSGANGETPHEYR